MSESRASAAHQPVLVQELIRWLRPGPGQVVLDLTVGLGGHLLALAPFLAGGRYIGLDVDEAMLEQARARAAGISDPRIDLIPANYAEARSVLADLGVEGVDLALGDLGVNSAQLSDPLRGMSFDLDGPLDMRFDRRQKTTAAELLNRLSERELADLIYQLGQDPLSRKIARRICDARRDQRIVTTRTLAAAVESVYSATGSTAGRRHPATRVFQALRMAVNRELENLEALLSVIPDLLRPGGRVAIISFHSLEDGAVKQFMREGKARGSLRLLTREPVLPSADERRANPRSRSAKMRVAERPGTAE